MISRCLIEILICCLYNLCYTINYNVQHGKDMEGTSTVSLHTERISPEMLNGYPPEYAEWLNDVIARLPYYQEKDSGKDIRGLLPDVWKLKKSNENPIEV